MDVERKQNWAAAGVVSALAFVIYLPTLSYDLLSWDDEWYVTHNPLIKALNAENLRVMFTEPYAANYLPLHLLSYAIDHALWGDKSLGYHLSSVAINALSAGLSLWVLVKIGLRLSVSFGAALLFALHHSHVSSVAWVSSRKGVLALCFVLLCTLAWLQARRDPTRTDRRWYALALLLYGCSLLSKLTMMMLPAFLFLHSWLKSSGFRFTGWGPAWKLLRLQLPFALLALPLAIANARAQAVHRGHGGLLELLQVKGEALWRYMAVLTGWHGGQPVYSMPESFGGGGLILRLFPVALILGCLVWAWRRQRQTPLLALTWILAMLLPALAFPLVTYMADRYLYAASLGFCWLLSAGLWLLARQRLAIFATLLVIPALVFALRLYQYMPVWRDSETLMTYANARCDDSRVREHLASAMMRRQAFDEAIALLAADTERERYGSLRITAHCLFLKQDYAAAEPLYALCTKKLRAGEGALQRTLERTGLRRSGVDVLRNYAQILLEGERSRPAEAIALLAPFADSMPDARLHFLLGTAYYRSKQHRAAQPALQKAYLLGIREGLPASWLGNCGFSLGAVHWAQGERDKAREIWQNALQHDASNTNLHSWLAK
jgi:tetratricopeptide (TPR) repeat protein